MPLLSMVALVLWAAFEYECLVATTLQESADPTWPTVASLFAHLIVRLRNPSEQRSNARESMYPCLCAPQCRVFTCKFSSLQNAAHNKHVAQFLDVTIFTGHLMLGYFETAYRLGPGCMRISLALGSPAPGRKEFPSNNFWLLTVCSSEGKQDCSEG